MSPAKLPVLRGDPVVRTPPVSNQGAIKFIAQKPAGSICPSTVVNLKNSQVSCGSPPEPGEIGILRPAGFISMDDGRSLNSHKRRIISRSESLADSLLYIAHRAETNIDPKNTVQGLLNLSLG